MRNNDIPLPELMLRKCPDPSVGEGLACETTCMCVQHNIIISILSISIIHSLEVVYYNNIILLFPYFPCNLNDTEHRFFPQVVIVPLLHIANVGMPSEWPQPATQLPETLLLPSIPETLLLPSRTTAITSSCQSSLLQHTWPTPHLTVQP